MNKNFISAIAVLLGTIVGAGIFGIPYAILKGGVVPGFFYFLILGGVVLLIHLFFGEVTLRTNGDLRMVGYAEKYFGRWGKNIITFSMIVGSMGVLLVFTILGGDFLKIIFSSSGISSFSFSIIFLIILSIFILRGMRLIAQIEIFTNIIFFLIIFIIFIFGIPKISLDNFSLSGTKDLFLPYGIILFSLVGWTAIPELKGILKRPEEKKEMKKVLVLVALLSFLLYVFFAFIVLGVSGNNTSAEALQGLAGPLGNKVIFFGALAAIITLADSFLISGICLRNTLIYDFKIKKNLAVFITCVTPLTLFLIGFREFIGTIGFIGTFFGVIEGIFIILMYKKAKKIFDREPEYSIKVPSFVIYILMSVFVLGAVFQIIFD